MPYREKKYKCGNILDAEIFPITLQERKQSRKIKQKESVPKQKNLNDKNAKKYFTRLVNNNFTDFDIVVHLTYKNGTLPADEREAKKDVTNYIRRLKRYRKKLKLPPLKYVAVIEYGRKKKRLHHHIIMSGDMNRDEVEQLWGKGRANADRLKADEYGYEALSTYIGKDPQGNRRWVQSKNLKLPKPIVNDFKFRKREVEELALRLDDRATFEKLYPGYIFTECKVYRNEEYGTTYLYIKMRLGNRRKSSPKNLKRRGYYVTKGNRKATKGNEGEQE